MDHDCVRALLKRVELEDVGIGGGGDQQDSGEQGEEGMGQDVDQSGHDSNEGEGGAEGEECLLCSPRGGAPASKVRRRSAGDFCG